MHHHALKINGITADFSIVKPLNQNKINLSVIQIYFATVTQLMAGLVDQKHQFSITPKFILRLLLQLHAYLENKRVITEDSFRNNKKLREFLERIICKSLGKIKGYEVHTYLVM